MTRIDNEKFGDLIRRLRKEKHMTQKELVFLLFRCGLPWEQLKELMKITAMMLLFGVWLCFLIPRQLPPYYDQNKIDYFTQGPFRIHMPGLSFSNRNWFYISRVLRIFLLAVMVLYPLACCILFFFQAARISGIS